MSFGQATTHNLSDVRSESTTETSPKRCAKTAVRRAMRVTPIDWLFVGLPCITLLALLITCLTTEADLAISRMFFSETDHRWPWADIEPLAWCYRSGCKPSVILGVGGLIIGLASLSMPSLRRWRRHGLFLALTLAIGPGLIVNLILKPTIARPRPIQTEVFGGQHEFAYMGSNVNESITRSFPSGHASMGFFLMTPALLFYRRRPKLAFAILAVGMSYGTLVGVARIAQGAHFATDVIASALFVYSSGVFVLCARRVFKLLFYPQTTELAQETEGDINVLSFPVREATEKAPVELKRAA